MVSIFLQCTWSVFWALAVYAVYWILVLTKNPKWAVKSPQLKFKVILYLFLFSHKVEAKVRGYTFPLNLSWFLLQRLI